MADRKRHLGQDEKKPVRIADEKKKKKKKPGEPPGGPKNPMG